MRFDKYITYLTIVWVFVVNLVLSTSPDTSPSTSSSSSSTTSATTPETTPKLPEQKRIALASIKTFDFSSMDSAPSPAEEKTCVRPTTNPCETMKGICNNGTCQVGNCSSDTVTCICKGGDYGRFCEKKATKEHVNGAIQQTPDSNVTNEINDNNGNMPSASTQSVPGNEISNVNRKNNVNMHKEGTTTSGTITSSTETETQSTTNMNDVNESTIQKSNRDIHKKDKKSVNGYKKGPEVFVGNDTSVLNLKSTKNKIYMETPALIDKTSATVTLSTVSWKNTKVGLPKESLETLVTSRKDPVNKKVTSDAKSQPKRKSPTQNKNKVVLSKTNIAQVSNTVLTEGTGVVKNSAKTISTDTTVSLSDVKTAVGTSSDIKGVNKNTENKASGKENQSAKNLDKSPVKKPNGKNVTNGNKPVVADTVKGNQRDKPNNNMIRDEIIKIRKDITITKESIINQASQANTDSGLEATGKVLVNADVLTSASQHLEMRKSMQSSVLNPLFKFLSMIGSANFNENVSSVKIEIITKKNGTANVNNEDTNQLDKTSNTTSTSSNITTDNDTSGTNSSVDNNVTSVP
ncbi:hypothetical protein ACF0H5_004413 [Mactra antiquata]